ncbi:hypothetical protein [Pelomonas cellulosilytica]|uniref:Uncharacterized protein n=1 Tax=Pelomonas cellulosilytica TaxID=2906762 RepID=A0ABS8Y171_9BURK|nr:hypothetical protein [Pelomonas sp. P8]MCE4555495.1 hypothetical protein [Pelomonas sp. P8]
MNRISTTNRRTANLQAAAAVALIALVATTGAAWMTLTVPAEGQAIVTLEPVLIEGRRSNAASDVAELQQLPRVVVVGRRSAEPVQLASAN